MLTLDASATRARLPFAALIPALHRAFVAGCELPLRHTHTIANPHGPAGTVLLMPAWRPGARLGIKTVTIFPGNSARGRPGLHSLYTLFDATTGEPLAQLDGNEITSRRTAAAAALAASFLARADAARLLVLGAGRVAALVPEAMRSVRPITQVLVWNHRAENAQRLVDTLRTQGVDAEAATDLDAAVATADIVSSATLATAPLVRGAALQPGTHLDLIGSFTPAMRESDADCFARARVFVDTDEALVKSGDVIGARDAGAFADARLQGTLAQLCRGERGGRAGPGRDHALQGRRHGTRRPRGSRAGGRRYAAGMTTTAPDGIDHWEDFPVGSVRRFGATAVTREEVLEFAGRFDPQPFHLDDAAAEASLFGKLSASGWHTCAMAMRMMCDGYLLRAASLGSPGIDKLKWHRPVYPGDTLSVRFTVLEARPMNSRPDVGLVRSLSEVLNQHGEVVQSMEGWGMFRRRQPAGAQQ